MHGEFAIPIAVVYGFLLALARVSGVFVFIPLPGLQSSPASARIFLGVSVTIAIMPFWPVLPAQEMSIVKMIGLVVSEAGLGLSIGLIVAFVLETLAMAAQLVGVQSGYGFSSTIDPTTQADSTILITMAQLLAGMLFFSLGLDRFLIRALVLSLKTHPPGALAIPMPVTERIIGLGSQVFSTGLRLALPMLALLTLIDIALALLGRLNAHIQLLSVAFPLKMLATIGMLSGLLVLYSKVFAQSASRMTEVVSLWMKN